SQRCRWYVAGTRTLKTPSLAFSSPSLPSSRIGRSVHSVSYSASDLRVYLPGATACTFNTGLVGPVDRAVPTPGTSGPPAAGGWVRGLMGGGFAGSAGVGWAAVEGKAARKTRVRERKRIRPPLRAGLAT